MPTKLDSDDLKLLAYFLGEHEFYETANFQGFMEMLEYISDAALVFTQTSRTIRNVWENHIWDDAMKAYADAIVKTCQEQSAPDDDQLALLAAQAIKAA